MSLSRRRCGEDASPRREFKVMWWTGIAEQSLQLEN